MKNKYFFIAVIAIIVMIFPSLSGAQNTSIGWIGEHEDCTINNAIDVSDVKGQKNFPKNEGKYKLCLKKLETVRTFTSIDKVVNRFRRSSACSISYTVNKGQNWNSHHPHWNTPGARISNNQINECGQGNANIPNPNATHQEWKVYSKIYWFDKTPPVCGESEFFKNLTGNERINYDGGWTKEKIYVQFRCDDQNLSGCADDHKGVSERVQVLYGNDYAGITFKDRVDNVTTRQCLLGKGFKPYKYDPNPPTDTVKILEIPKDGKSDANDNNNTNKPKDVSNVDEVYLFAGKKKIDITIVDEKSPYADMEGISGVKNINFISNPIGETSSVCNFQKQENIDENIDANKKSSKTFSAECDYTKVGQYNFNLTYEDQAGNKVEKNKKITIVPNNELSLIIDKEEISGEGMVFQNDNAYSIFANHEDTFTFYLHLEDSYGNRIKNKNFIFINPADIPLIQGNPKSGNALTTTRDTALSTTDNNGEIGKVIIKSHAPGELKNKFKINIPKWNEKYEDIRGTNRFIEAKDNEKKYFFLPLFIADMKLVGDDSIIFGQKQKLQFIFQENEASKGKPQNIKTDAFHSVTTDSAKEWKMTYQNDVYVDISGNKTIEREFIPEQIAEEITQEPDILAKPRIEYDIEDKHVSYNVGKNYSIPVEPLTFAGGEVNKIFIGGQEQAQGKQEFVSDTSKIGNNSWVTARNFITREVAELTRNRRSDGQIINDVKYVSGDQTLSGDVNRQYKTLIVEDGNVTFDDNFNTKKENIAIILVNKNDKNKSKIFIKPNVAFISALIFAENSIESVGVDGNPFTESNRTRTQTLSKQIVFHGGLYTRNTIGGAVAGTTGKYILPGNVETANIHEAVRYDLSFLRMKAGGRDDDLHTKKFNQGRTESVVVWPNVTALTNPPPGFRLK